MKYYLHLIIIAFVLVSISGFLPTKTQNSHVFLGDSTATSSLPVIVVDPIEENKKAKRLTEMDNLKANETLNKKIDTVLVDINKSQEDYFKKNARYWQGLKTHDTPPIAGVETQITKLDDKTNNQTESLKDVGIKYSKLPFSFTVIEYKIQMPDNSIETGYQVEFSVTIDGEVYTKAIGYGVEAGLPKRTHDWQYWKGI